MAGVLDALQMPHSLEAEQAVLGSIFLSNKVYEKVSGIIGADDFFEPVHRIVWDAITSLIAENINASALTVLSRMPPVKGDVDIPKYLGLLTSEAAAPYVAVDNARMILEYAIRRRLIQTALGAIDRAATSSPDDPAIAQIEELEKQVYSLRPLHIQDQTGFVSFGQAANEAVEKASRAYQGAGGLTGMSTGFPSLDERMGGLSKSDVVILAGRPGAGKSALAMNIALAVAKSYVATVDDEGVRHVESGGVVAVFSLEMTRDQLAARELAAEANVASVTIRKGTATEDDLSAFINKAHELAGLQIYIDHTGQISLAQLALKARALKRKHGLDLIVIDYLQLMKGSSRTRAKENRTQEITEITTGLKGLAKELDVCIIALSQLSREVERRDPPRPQLSDLRDSGSIEQDADVVMFVFREEYYVRQREPKRGTEEFAKWESDMAAVRGMAEVIIGKQRHGPTGTIAMGFDGELTRFLNDPPERDAPKRERREVHKLKAKHVAIYDALLAALDASAKDQETPGVPAGVKACTTTDVFSEFRRRSIPDGDPEKFETKLRAEMSAGLKALRDERVVGIVRNDDKSAFIWLTDRQVKRP